MKTKKANRAKKLFAAGDLKRALGIYKTFPFGFTREEKRAIEIAYESLIGREGFYRRLGIDTSAMIAQSKDIIYSKYFI